jgi:hypothetical protein
MEVKSFVWRWRRMAIFLKEREIVIEEVDSLAIDFTKREFRLGAGRYILSFPLQRAMLKRARQFFARFCLKADVDEAIFPPIGTYVDVSCVDGSGAFVGPISLREFVSLAGENFRVEGNTVIFKIPLGPSGRRVRICGVEYYYPAYVVVRAQKGEREGMRE